MTPNTRIATLIALGLAVMVSLALAASNQPTKEGQKSSSLASKLLSPTHRATKVRSARSLSDMFEKVRSKIFGSRKQQAQAASPSQQSAAIQPAASANSASAMPRMPFGDLNSFNQQYSPYNYQWPSGANGASNNFAGAYSPMSGFANSPVAYPGPASSQPAAMNPGMDGQSAQQQPIGPAANSNLAQSGQGGLLASASQMIAQYLSPSSAGSSPNTASSSQQQQQQVVGQNGAQNQQLSPQQQSQYNEFASILDSMVAQTGVSSPRQPSAGQFMNGQPQVGAQQQQQLPQGYQQQQGNLVGDNEMSGSSNVQSYMPAASAQPASQKSSMVSLAEQLAPGAQFNKLVSFPFSLTSNDDPSKEGRYKLHIPFLNQHVKRSDQQQANSAAAAAAIASGQRQRQMQQQQQQQQYLSSYINQQPAGQMVAQLSQVVPTHVSPQSAASAAVVAASAVSSPVSSQSSASIQPQSQSQPQQHQSSSSMLSASPSNPASVSAISPNSRSAWSVADHSSSSKLIPMAQVSPSASSASASSSSSAAALSSSSSSSSSSANSASIDSSSAIAQS